MPLRGALLSLPQKFSKGRLYRDPQPTWVVTAQAEKHVYEKKSHPGYGKMRVCPTFYT